MAKKGIPNADPGKFEGQTTILSVKFGSECYLVGDNAFKGCESLAEIIEDNVIEEIGSNAFDSTKISYGNFNNLVTMHSGAFNNCNRLVHIGIPKCTVIPNEAFKNCLNLSDISFDNVIEIKDGAFIGCKGLNKIDLNKCEKIGASAFRGCENISQVTLKSCKEIDMYAFANCPNLDKVYIDNIDTFCNLKGGNVFCDCEDSFTSSCPINTTFYFKANVYNLYIEDEHWRHYINNMIMMSENNQIVYKTNDSNKVNVNNDNTNPITNHTYKYYGLIEFENDVKSINKQMFMGAINLTSIDIPSCCTSIEDSAFEDCENLNKITLPNLSSIGRNAFKNCKSKSFTSFDIPSSVTAIGEGVIAGCNNLNSISGKFVTYGGKAIVYNNTLIYILPINAGRLYNISDIDKNITRLGESCFQDCVNIRRVNIPSNVESIGDNVFYGCKNLCEIHFDNTEPPQIGYNVFDGVREDYKIFVPEECLELYYNSWVDMGYGDHIYPKPSDNSIIYYGEGEDFDFAQEFVDRNLENGNGKYYRISDVDKILTADYFNGKPKVEEVILGEGITEIDVEAFRGCEDMKYIYLSDNITSLNDRAFLGCKSLTKIHIPQNIESFKGFAIFNGCISLKEFIAYDANLVSSDDRCYIKDSILMFFAQGNLSENEKDYIIPDNIVEINKNAFAGADITSITLNQSTKTIGAFAFSHCGYLQSIFNWDNVINISDHAFSGCSSLGKISFPSKLEIISKHAFNECGEMYTNTNIPNSVIAIGESAFCKCFNFKCVDESTGEDVGLNLEKITNINDSVFYQCQKLTKVNVSKDITRIGNQAFEDCINLTDLKLSLFGKLNSIGDSAFRGCKKYKGYNYLQPATEKYLMLPECVEEIGESCFEESGVEQFIVISTSKLSTIPKCAFKNCINLSKIKLSNNIHTIKDEAFNGCINVLDVTLPSPSSLPLYLGNLCFAIGNGETSQKIYIPDGLGNPPYFTINDKTEPSPYNTSFPFGNVNENPDKIPTIIIPYEYFEERYKPDVHWKKYLNYMYPTIEYTYLDITNCIIPNGAGDWNIYGNSGVTYSTNFETSAIFHAKNVSFNGNPIDVPCCIDTNKSGELRIRFNKSYLDSKLATNIEYHLEVMCGVRLNNPSGSAPDMMVTYLFNVYYNGNKSLVLSDRECYLVINKTGVNSIPNITYTNNAYSEATISLSIPTDYYETSYYYLSNSGNFGYGNMYLLSNMRINYTGSGFTTRTVQMNVNSTYHTLANLSNGTQNVYMIPSSFTFIKILEYLKGSYVRYIFS